MKKDKVRAYIWIGIVSIILGVIISFQIKVVRNNLLDGNSPSIQSKRLITELEAITQKKKMLEEEVNTLEAKLETIKSETSKENSMIKALNDELKEYKMFAGLTDVYGSGIKIIIDNSKNEYSANSTNIVYEYNLILNLINELNAAGSEAISINGQRLINKTEIRTAGDTLMVNKIPIISPIEIKSIGDSKTLSGSINQRFGIVSILRNNGYFVEVFQEENLIINKFDGVIEFDYIKNMDN